MDDYEVRIDDKFLKGDHKDGEVLTSSELNELENVVKTAINANYEDIQKLGNGEIPVGDADTLTGASLSKYNDEALQNSDTKIPSSMQVKQYVDGAISNIDLEGYYTKREVDDIVATYDSDGNGIVDNAEKVNNHTVNKDVPADAKFTDTVVTKTSELTNDSGFLTSETDPVFNASPAKTITSSNISNWNSKQAALVSGSNIKTINGSSILGSGNLTIQTNLTAGDNISINNNVISADLSSKQDKIDSSHKLNADLVDDTSSTNKFTSASEKSTWNGKYDKPSGGIPKTDLATDVQTSLGKADTAIQDISGKQDIIQYSTMPTASSSNEGNIIQFVGTTDSTYTNGYFYKCVEDNSTYSWEAVNVQASSGGGNVPMYVWNGKSSTQDPTTVATITAVLNHILNNEPFNIVYIAPEDMQAYQHLWYFTGSQGISKYGGSGYIDLSFGYTNGYGFGTNPGYGMEYSTGYLRINVDSNNNFAYVSHNAFQVQSNRIRIPNTSQILMINNSVAFTPTAGSYQPATAKYVDDSISNAIGSINTILATLTTPSSGGGE